MRRLIVGAILTVIIVSLAYCDDYKPLTRQEAGRYIDVATRDMLISDIIRLDYIEHAIPDVHIPGFIFAAVDGVLVVMWADPGIITVSVSDPLGGGDLISYDIAPDDVRDENVLKYKSGKSIGCIALTVLSGPSVALGIKALTDDSPKAYILSFAGGAIISALSYIFTP